MARSNKPFVWSLFAGGGMFSAFVTPAMIFITGIVVPLGHAAHRLRMTLHDLGVPGARAAVFAGNGPATLGSISAAISLLRI